MPRRAGSPALRRPNATCRQIGDAVRPAPASVPPHALTPLDFAARRRDAPQSSMLAVVLYTFPGDHARVRMNAAMYLPLLLREPKLRVYITVSSREPSPVGFDPRVRLLRCDHPEGYECMPDKTIRMLRELAQDPSISHVLKVDSDVVLDPRGVLGLLRDLDRHDYAGFRVNTVTPATRSSDFHRGRCSDPDLDRVTSNFDWARPSVSYLGGPCYLLSMRAIRNALRAFDSSGIVLGRLRATGDSRGFLEDALVGWLVNQGGIAPQRSMVLLQLGVGLAGKLKVLLSCCRRYGIRDLRGAVFVGFICSNRHPSRWDSRIIRAWLSLRGMSGARRDVPRTAAGQAGP